MRSIIHFGWLLGSVCQLVFMQTRSYMIVFVVCCLINVHLWVWVTVASMRTGDSHCYCSVALLLACTPCTLSIYVCLVLFFFVANTQVYSCFLSRRLSHWERVVELNLTRPIKSQTTHHATDTNDSSLTCMSMSHVRVCSVVGFFFSVLLNKQRKWTTSKYFR